MLLPLSVKLGKIQLFFQLANNFHTFFSVFFEKKFSAILFSALPNYATAHESEYPY